jgi:molybdenum transport protein
MIYFPDALIDQWIIDDVNQGELTTRILGIGEKLGRISFRLSRQGGIL